MSSADDYRKHAQAAREIASVHSDAADKSIWLKMAQEWDRMADEADRGHQSGQLAQQPGIFPAEGST